MPKTIFGTTERSNFILNMKPAAVEKLVTIGLCLVALLPLISSGIVAIIDSNFYILAVGPYIAGFISLLFFLINALRGDITLTKNVGFWLIVGMAGLALVTYYTVFLDPYEGLERAGFSNGKMTPLIGEYGRYEGLLMLIAYFGIALLGFCAKNALTLKKTFIAIAIAGAVQGIFAVLQHIPGLGFPNAFRHLPTYAYDNVYLSSGLTDSPIFYGSFVTLIFALCGGACIFLELKLSHRLIAGGLALLSFTTGLFTSSITPLIGCAAAILIIFVLVLVKREKGTLTRFGIFLALAAVIFGIVFASQGIWIRDFFIAQMDDFTRKFLVGDSSGLSGETIYDVAWGRSVDAIKARPIFGVGPDSFAAWQNFTTQSFDKSYNEYLYVAVTRGIPAALLFIALIVTAAVRLIKNIKNPYAAVLLTAVAAYSVQAAAGASAVTVAPMFWLILGLSFSPAVQYKKADAIDVIKEKSL